MLALAAVILSLSLALIVAVAVIFKLRGQLREARDTTAHIRAAYHIARIQIAHDYRRKEAHLLRRISAAERPPVFTKFVSRLIQSGGLNWKDFGVESYISFVVMDEQVLARARALDFQERILSVLEDDDVDAIAAKRDWARQILQLSRGDQDFFEVLSLGLRDVQHLAAYGMVVSELAIA